MKVWGWVSPKALTSQGEGLGPGQSNRRCDGVSWPVEISVK